MAKTRAQRKAERRAREAEQQAQRDTQTGKSGEVADVEAVEKGMGAGAPEDQLETPDAPKQSRAERRAAAMRRSVASFLPIDGPSPMSRQKMAGSAPVC